MTTQQKTTIGSNKTGIQMSPKMAEEMMDAAMATEIIIDLSNREADEIRKTYIAEADPIGSVPPPGTLKGMAKASGKLLSGNRPQAFIDKLAERLGFERSGVRLYDALILKCEQSQEQLPLDELRHIREEELQHFSMLKEVIESIGADPTALTPAADVATVASQGVFKVVTDPATTVLQSLEAVLIAELTDSDCWALLTELAGENGFSDFVERFREAGTHEDEHVMKIRRLVRDLNMKAHKLVA